MKKKDNKEHPIEQKKVPRWKEAGFKSQKEYDEWLNEWYEDIRGGYI